MLVQGSIAGLGVKSIVRAGIKRRVVYTVLSPFLFVKFAEAITAATASSGVGLAD
jgi:hypothetical protein